MLLYCLVRLFISRVEFLLSFSNELIALNRMKIKILFLTLLCVPILASAKTADGTKSNDHLKSTQLCTRTSCIPVLVFDAHVYQPSSEEFLASIKDLPAGTTILLSGYGKDVTSGVKMGEMIRSKQLKTKVGRLGDANLERTGFYKRAGVCLSACAMAFMGGVNREFDKEDQFGVTAIEPNQPNLSEQDLQLGLTNTEGYLSRMNLQPSFFKYLKGLNDSKLHMIDVKAATAYNIIDSSPK